MSQELFDLTGFQRDILYILAGHERSSGQDIKDELEEVHGDITHGRLYPNLDTLVDRGFVEKGEIDRRTNAYALTEKGYEALVDRREWENRYLDVEDIRQTSA